MVYNYAGRGHIIYKSQQGAFGIISLDDVLEVLIHDQQNNSKLSCTFFMSLRLRKKASEKITSNELYCKCQSREQRQHWVKDILLGCMSIKKIYGNQKYLFFLGDQKKSSASKVKEFPTRLFGQILCMASKPVVAAVPIWKGQVIWWKFRSHTNGSRFPISFSVSFLPFSKSLGWKNINNASKDRHNAEVEVIPKSSFPCQEQDIIGFFPPLDSKDASFGMVCLTWFNAEKSSMAKILFNLEVLPAGITPDWMTNM